MRYKLICILANFFDTMSMVCFFIAAPIIGILCLPLFIATKINDWYEERKQAKIEEKLENIRATSENINKLSYKSRELMLSEGKVKMSKIPHDLKNYTQENNQNLYMFHGNRKLVLEFTTIAYIENKYSERMHRFFEEQSDWIKEFEEWHAWKIVFVDCDLMREGMFFPQDFDNHMNHGFLWNAYSSSGDPEYNITGDRHLYFDINLTTDDDIKKQMHLMMSKIYATFQWQLI